ncbi:hypothetical protein [Pedobacter aquatilis]|uniref:hypothetical protein n=1 Tax=Pedobacter aquatilis TaxID=351343 RepID=UPI00292E2FAD|nr:hypothetical protein [Pedobacter aquatilis]
MDEFTALGQLKICVLNKCGWVVYEENHALILSKLIFEQTRNYLSKTTLARFFRFEGKHPLFNSIFMLNTLSQFLGYVDWKDFLNAQDKGN